MILETLRNQILETCLRMVADGLSHGSAGNLSALDRESGLIAITPSALEYHMLQPEDIAVVDREGRLVEGRWKPTSELAMHTIFYRQRPEVGAVVHTHAPYASVFAIAHQPIPMVLAEAAPFLGGAAPAAAYARTGSQELAEVMLETLYPGQAAEAVSSAALMANHGLLSIGPNLELAYQANLCAELSARLTYMARAMGATPVEIATQEVAALRALVLSSYKPTAPDSE